MEFESLDRNAKIFVAGHKGMVGSALIRRLQTLGFSNLLTIEKNDLDLRDQSSVNAWFKQNEPDHVYLAAGTVGGIMANSTRQAEFLYDNLMIHATVIEASRLTKVDKLLYLGSSCIYPRESEQPISENSLLTGPLEPTNEGYAIAKIAGIKLCQFYREQYGCNFITAMPTNLYGPNDNYDSESSHVLPALLRKFHEAKENELKSVELWGTGVAKREFLHVDDLAYACLFLMNNYSAGKHINIGTGNDVSIAELAKIIRRVVYPLAKINFDISKPDGMLKKQLDVSKLSALGWKSQINLPEGIEATYRWFLENLGKVRGMD